VNPDADGLPAADGTERGERDGRRRSRGGRGRRDRGDRGEARTDGDVSADGGAASAERISTPDVTTTPVDFDTSAEVRPAAAAAGGAASVGVAAFAATHVEAEPARTIDTPAAEPANYFGARVAAYEPVADAVVRAPVVAAEPVSAPIPTPAPPAPVYAAPAAAASVAAAPMAEPAWVSTPAPAAAAAASTQPFVLQTDALHAVAETAGLQWVGSDASKIRAAQEALVNEPAPLRAGRTPKNVVAAEDGPLVMIETVKDLAQVKLPFEH
jgi:ribonuclease E